MLWVIFLMLLVMVVLGWVMYVLLFEWVMKGGFFLFILVMIGFGVVL